MSAELIAALTACQAGDEIVSMLDIYGGTVKLFEDVLARCGITTRFIPYRDLGKAERYFTPKTQNAVPGDADESDAALRRYCGPLRYRAPAQGVCGGG